MSKNDDSFFNINIPMALIFLILPIAAGYYLAALFSVNEPNDIYTVIERCKIIIDKPLDWYFNLLTIPVILFMILLYAMTVLVIACMHKPYLVCLCIQAITNTVIAYKRIINKITGIVNKLKYQSNGLSIIILHLSITV